MNKDNELVDEANAILANTGYPYGMGMPPRNNIAEELIDLITKHNCQEAVEAVENYASYRHPGCRMHGIYRDIIRDVTTRLMGESDE